jgi:hypothetical protein
VAAVSIGFFSNTVAMLIELFIYFSSNKPNATIAKIRILPPRDCKPQRGGRRFGPAIQLPEPTASVQIPWADSLKSVTTAKRSAAAKQAR